MFTPQEIKDISFKRATFGGYDMDSVDAYLEPLTGDYITLYQENTQLKSKLRELVIKMEKSRRNNLNTQDTVANAQQAYDKIIQEAQEKAAQILADAQKAANEAAQRAGSGTGTQLPGDKLAEIQEQLSRCVAAIEQLRSSPAQQAPKASTERLPSIEKPWLKFYPKGAAEQMKIPAVNLSQYMKMMCRGEDLVAIHYYGTDITWRRLNALVEKTAKAMRAAGLGEGDQIPVMLQAVPEFVAILLAADRIGASVLCRDNTIEENAEAVAKAKAKVMFVHDYISQEEADAYIAAGVEKIITVSPLNYAILPEMPQHILSNLNSRYPAEKAVSSKIHSWYGFQAKADTYAGPVDAEIDLSRPLFRAYTSGSTGPSKQVIHSAQTMLVPVHQLSAYASSEDFRPTWLVMTLPPALIAVTASMILMPLASNKVLIMDPFADPNDVDLELMRYKPNGCAFIPMFFEILMRSKRIPEDYDMSHLLAAGAGAESFNNGQIRRAQKFLQDHKCPALFSMGFGLSEAASSLMFPCPAYPATDGSMGIPMPLNTIGIFKGEKEVGYNQVGEVCINTPGMMLGYDSEEATKKVIITHEDGRVWLHTGDSGYLNEDGVLYLLGRGYYKRFCGEGQQHKRLVEIVMENIIADAQIKGIRDAFFVFRPDKENEGFFVPYLFTVLEDGYTVDAIRQEVDAALEPHQRPVAVIQIPERPFFHFKTARLRMEVPE